MSEFYQNYCWFYYLVTVHKCIQVTEILNQFTHSFGLSVQCSDLIFGKLSQILIKVCVKTAVFKHLHFIADIRLVAHKLIFQVFCLSFSENCVLLTVTCTNGDQWYLCGKIQLKHALKSTI